MSCWMRTPGSPVQVPAAAAGTLPKLPKQFIPPATFAKTMEVVQYRFGAFARRACCMIQIVKPWNTKTLVLKSQVFLFSTPHIFSIQTPP